MFLTLNDIKAIAVQLQQRLDIDYPNYAVNFFRRRLNYAIEKMNLHRPQELTDMLNSIMKADEIAYYMSVPSTELFRDPSFWRSLRKYIQNIPNLTVWFPALTCGYELFSLLILLDQMGKKDYKIFVNCVSDRIIKDVKTCLIASKTEQINRSNFERLEWTASFDDYFKQQDDGRMMIKEDLLDKVDLRGGWFMNQTVEKYKLIIFRNALLEFSVPLHEKAVQRVCESMEDNALLAIGIKEKLLVKVPGVVAKNENEGIYGKGNFE